MASNRIILFTDRHTDKAKAAAVQSVLEITGIEPTEAIRLLALNDWNPSEAIIECVNLREFRERLRKQAELHDSHRLCTLSVNLMKLAHLKHTGMHSVRLDLDGDVQQTGWITGDHSKFVGTSFEFRRFRPESRIRIEVWHKRTFIEVWLRFFDLSLHSPPRSQQSTRQSSKKKSIALTAGSSSSLDRKTASSLNNQATTEFLENNNSKDKSTSVITRVTLERILHSKQPIVEPHHPTPKPETHSMDLLDDFFMSLPEDPTHSLPGESSSSTSAIKRPTSSPAHSWDLGSLDPQLFLQDEAPMLQDGSRRTQVAASSPFHAGPGRPAENEGSERGESMFTTPEEQLTGESHPVSTVDETEENLLLTDPFAGNRSPQSPSNSTPFELSNIEEGPVRRMENRRKDSSDGPAVESYRPVEPSYVLQQYLPPDPWTEGPHSNLPEECLDTFAYRHESLERKLVGNVVDLLSHGNPSRRSSIEPSGNPTEVARQNSVKNTPQFPIDAPSDSSHPINTSPNINHPP